MSEIPTFDCVRVVHPGDNDTLVFTCPHCWQYGMVYGACDVSSGPYKRRPKRAVPIKHVHGAGKNLGDGDGHRIAHCFSGSPLKKTGYYLREIAAEKRV